MTARIRGQEVTLRVSIDGDPQVGSLIKVQDFTVTPRTDLNEDDFLGEDESDLDIQHHGFDLKWSVQMQDGRTQDILNDIIARESAHTQHPDVVITVMYAFRENGERGRAVTYRGAFLKEDEEAASGRKERVVVQYMAKAKKRSTILL
jgi:hypothetical protein